eukprot:PhF_6_TR2252/c0_g1_i1/m.3854/K09527/DNAJC7; DnaJ homolog subfamily C member 7
MMSSSSSCCTNVKLQYKHNPSDLQNPWAHRYQVWSRATTLWQQHRTRRMDAKGKAMEEAMKAKRDKAEQQASHAEEWGRRLVAEGEAMRAADEAAARKVVEQQAAAAAQAPRPPSTSKGATNQSNNIGGGAAGGSKVRAVNTVADVQHTKVPSPSTPTSVVSGGLEELWCGSVTFQQQHQDATNHLQEGRALQALLIYDRIIEGIGAESSATITTAHSNRAHIYYRLDRYAECVTEAMKATEIDSNHTQGYLHAARAYTMLGNVRSARMMYTFLQSVSPDSLAVKTEGTCLTEVENYFRHHQEGNYSEARRCLGRIEQAFGKTAATEGWRVDLVLHTRLEDAHEEIQSLLESYGDHSIPLYLKAKCLFFTGIDPITTSTALQFVTRAIAAGSNCEKARPLEQCLKKFEILRHELQNHTIQKRWQSVVEVCTAILALDPSNRRLQHYAFVQRGNAHTRLGSYIAAVTDYSKALDLQESRAPHDVYILRADAYALMERYTEAIRDLEEAYRAVPSVATFEKLERCRKESVAQKQKAHAAGGGGYSSGRPRASSVNGRPLAQQRTLYDVLGAARDADVIQLNKCFRDAALRWHPDRWSGSTEEQRRHAEGIFKQVNHAYSVLTDVDQRQKYDAQLN